MDLRLFLVGFGLDISFCKYCGPIPCTHLYVRVRILKAIRCLTGSQCNCSRACAALSNLDLLSTKHAHMFCILCSLTIEVSGNPYIFDNNFYLFCLSQQKRPSNGVERLPPAKFSRGLVVNENYFNGESKNQALADKSFRSLPNSSTQQRKYPSYLSVCQTFLVGYSF